MRMRSRPVPQPPNGRLVPEVGPVVEADSQDLARRRMWWVAPGGRQWPVPVDALADPPQRLAMIGRPIRDVLPRSVAIVGSRSATPQGRALAASWAQALARQGIAVISGGAFGIDAAAHQGALRGGGHTIAVLASGADVDSPRSNRPLLDAVRQRGTVVSELPPGTLPQRHWFLHRNRLIAALAPATLVVQAASRSGALNTARHAADLNRIVMAVPGPVGDPLHAGCHDLIRDHIAELVCSPEQVEELIAPLTGW